MGEGISKFYNLFPRNRVFLAGAFLPWKEKDCFYRFREKAIGWKAEQRVNRHPI
jgi:hypothetical protein